MRTVGLSNVEKERAVDLAKAEAAARADVEKGVRASATLTAEETKRILEAADATATFKDRQKDLEQQLRANAETARYFGDMLSGAISDAVTDGNRRALDARHAARVGHHPHPPPRGEKGARPMNAPRIKLCELREYVSERTGRAYLSGFLGGARVILLKDERAECTGKEVARWAVFLEESQPRESRPAASADPKPAAGPRRPNGRADRVERQAPRPRETAADRNADQLLSGMGLDPRAPMRSDDLPF